MLTSLVLSGLILTKFQADAPLDLNGPFDKNVPSPESVLGYKIGDRITTYRDQERVLEKIAATMPTRIKRIDYGMSNDRHPLRVYAISTPKNIANLDKIQKEMERAATTGQKVSADTPTIVWVNETIHGNEPASFESGMALVYNLVAGRGGFAKSLDNVLVIVNPCYNPDGHERFAVSYNSYARGNYQPGNYEQTEVTSLWGRFNRYRFDMNRDRVSFSQVETQQEVALMQKWRPQIYLDQHGQVENYFFPPNPMSINANVDRARLNKWTDILGRECAKAFDATGWSYFIREDFDLYYPGYLDTHTTFSGAIGITHETDGGKVLAKTRRDGSVVTLREGAAKHLTAALACLKAAGDRKAELLADWQTYKDRARTGEHAGNFKRVIFTASDERVLNRLSEHLYRTGIRTYRSAGAFKQKAHDFWSDQVGDVEFPANSMIVDMSQEFGPVAKALMERNSDFEKEFIDAQMNKVKTAPEGENYPGPQGTEFYDMTGWALPYAYNVKAWWSEDTPKVPEVLAKGLRPGRVVRNNLGYVLRYTDQDDVLAVAELLRQDVKVSIMTAEMKLGGKTYPKGTFAIFAIRNGKDLGDVISDVAERYRIEFEALPTSYPDSGREGPGNRLAALSKPSIGLIVPNSPQLSGGTWYMLEQVYKLPFVSLSTGSLSSPSVLRDYSVLVAPAGSGAASNSKVKDWVREGGVLVVLGDSSSSVASFSNGSETRSLPGSLFRAVLESRSILSAGYEGETIAVLASGSSFPKVRKEGGAVVKFAADDTKKLLTGWSWGEESEKALKDTVWMHDEPTGQGHIIWFAEDINDRAMWPGVNKLFLNSLILAAGN
jgi:hypothetical protein